MALASVPMFMTRAEMVELQDALDSQPGFSSPESRGALLHYNGPTHLELERFGRERAPGKMRGRSTFEHGVDAIKDDLLSRQRGR